ncbi:MAG: hypothetical protein J7M14_02265 [Planctomycetes bacterium]|nr:hypothetical protein [Planctomycetota bacterium]
MDIKYYLIDDYQDDSLSADMTAENVRNNPEAKKRLYAFTSLLLNPADNQLYCGVTNFNNDIFQRFDPKTKEFTSLDYRNRFAPSTDFDVKIHRSLELDAQENCIYSISSALHRPNEYLDAPGSHLFRYHCATDEYEDLGRPLEHEYTQTITYDKQRQLIYGFTLEYFSFYVYSLAERKTIFHTRPASITHVSAIDDSGCIWSTWDRQKHNLFKYDPAAGKCTYFEHGFPGGGHSYMYPGAGPIDRMINIGDGFLYVALDTGALFRLTPETAEVEFLGQGSAATRLPGLIKGIKDDTLLCVTGDNYGTILMEYNMRTRGFATLARIEADERVCFRPHDIAILGTTVYIAETDNPKGACGLWEVELGEDYLK